MIQPDRVLRLRSPRQALSLDDGSLRERPSPIGLSGSFTMSGFYCGVRLLGGFCRVVRRRDWNAEPGGCGLTGRLGPIYLVEPSHWLF